MQTEEQRSDISTTLQVLILKVENHTSHRSYKARHYMVFISCLDLKKKKKPTIQIHYIKTVATMNIVWILN